jgi:cobyric acid synthase
MGTYLHGLFDEPNIRGRWLAAIGIPDCEVPVLSGLAARDREYDKLAAHFVRHLDMERMFSKIRVSFARG